MVTTIQTEAQACELGRSLLARGRWRPAVVVSVATGASAPYIDVDELHKAVGSECDIYTIRTGPLTFAFSDELPEGREVYGGASRVYSVDNDWVTDMYKSPLRFAFGPDADNRVLNQLIQDAMTAAHAAGSYAKNTNRPLRRLRPVMGRVQGLVAGRALVDVGSTWPALAYPDRLAPGTSAENAFRDGQNIAGHHDIDNNVFEPPAPQKVGDALSGLQRHQSVLLARVSKVSSRKVTLELYPSYAVDLSADEGSVELELTYSVGEVLPVVVERLDAAGLPEVVKPLDEEFVELAVEVSLLPGGPSWLSWSPGVAVREEPAPRQRQRLSTLTGADPAAQEIVGLQSTVADLQARVQELESLLRESRSLLRGATKKLQTTQRDLRAALDTGDGAPQLFGTDEEQFHYEIYKSWAERTTAADKDEHPWTRPVLGEGFLATLNDLQGISRSKVVNVAADVCSGRAWSSAGLAVHQLRSGDSGNAPPVTRAGGEVCWRVALQQNTPSARRLHFWQLPGGRVELSSVRLHDDFRP